MKKDEMTEVTALTKDKLLHVLRFIGNHGTPIPISYIQQLYDKYGDKYDFETGEECKLISENSYWRSGWRDKNGTFTNDYYKCKEEIEDLSEAQSVIDSLREEKHEKNN